MTATREDITQAYRRAARRRNPHPAPGAQEQECRGRMQLINEAYQRLKVFLEGYRYRLEDTENVEDVGEWWRERFYTGVWGPPPEKGQSPEDKDPKLNAGGPAPARANGRGRASLFLG